MCLTLDSEIKHKILTKYHENFNEVNKFNFMLEIDISRISIYKILKNDFLGFGCPNDTQMPYWLRQ